MPGRYIRPVRSGPPLPPYEAVLAGRYNDLAERNGECVSLQWGPLRGFERGSPRSADGAVIWQRVSEAEVLAEMARMAADGAGEEALARRLAEVVEG